ncbi:MAG: methyltransferase domain-containing protein, partial [Candidatus Dormibacteraeota bacterium]|nr:methyltransferase domain-containing protein [Candidatus Dormibacteraeota bacterium]
MGLASTFYEAAYRYGSPRWDQEAPAPEVVELAGQLSVGRALDLGCGTGTNSLHLAQQGWSVVGLDFSSTAIERARERGHGLDVRFLQGDVADL